MESLLFRLRRHAYILVILGAFSPMLASADVLTSIAPAPLETFSVETPQIIVKYKASDDLSVVDAAPQVPVATVIKDIESDPTVEYAEPNYVRAPMVLSTSDTFASLLWGHSNSGQIVNGTSGTAGADLNIARAWTISTGTQDVLVGVVDTGVDYLHPDLAASMWNGSACIDENGAAIAGGCMHGYDFANNDADPLPSTDLTDESAFHGTHIAGTVGAGIDNGIGIAGVTDHAKIVAIRFGLDVASEVKAIDFAIQNGVKIINASYGGTEFSQAEYDAIARFRDAGGIFVTAAGNGGTDGVGDNNDSTHEYPSDYDLSNIVSVAATDQNDNLASFSNYGAQSVDVAAPGTNIASTYYLNDAQGNAQYVYADGTSMSTAYVSGVVALLWSFDPSLTAAQVKEVILDTGDPLIALAGKTTSGKRVDAYNALLSVSSSSVAVLAGLPDATDTTAIPNLDVTVGGTNVTEYLYSLDGGDWSATTSAATHITAQALENGPHTLSVVAGNDFSPWQSTASSTDYSWTVDDETAPVIAGLSDDASAGQSKTWTWSSTDPSAVFRYEVSTSSEPLALASSTYATTTSAVAPSDPGTYYLHVQAEDNNGNESATTTVSAVISAPAPAAPVSSGGGSSSGGGGGGGGGGAAAPAVAAVTTVGDTNGDAHIDLLDFNSIIVNWGRTGQGIAADLNKDGVVDLLDFNLVMVHWAP